MDNDIQRAIPQAIEAEQSVIGALLLDNDAVDRVGNLRAFHFYRSDHRAIYTEIVGMITEGGGVGADPITVYQRLDSKGKAQEVGGLSYLNALAQNTPSAANIARYAESVVDRAQKRGLMAVANDIQGEAANTPKAAAELIDAAGAAIEKLGEAVVRSEPIRASDGATAYLTMLEERAEGRGPKVIGTGLTDLDRKLGGGFNPGDLVVIAARPSMGKTAISLGIAAYVAARGPVLFLSLEMSNEQTQPRLFANQGRVSMNALRDVRGMSNEDYSRVTVALSKINELELHFDYPTDAGLLEVRSKARTFKRKHGSISLLVVDYLGLMKLGDEERHDLKIGAITRGLKLLAKELDCPIVLLSQLNRGVEQRPNKRPMMSDLKDSGSIEADADTIMFLYRDEVYNPDSMDKCKAEIIIGKQRQGETGTVGAAFFGEFQRFEDLAHGVTFGARPEQKRLRGGFD
ncbi:replicative DNA helicase [Paraburkholderia sediminicola]|uniref:replicative DNA helicase n=1 Tax=Paraburkholderia sediminicola TaxID=458836 RepID=UPI0038BA0009